MDPVNELIARAIQLQGRGIQARIARELDVEPQTVTKWKKGEMRPDRERWPRLEEILGMEPGSIRQAVIEATAGQEVADLPTLIVELTTEIALLRSELRDRFGPPASS